MEKMTFRESLVVSKVDKRGQTEPVGGLTVDVQEALGAKWDKPKKLPDFTKALMDACVDLKSEFFLQKLHNLIQFNPTPFLENYAESSEDTCKKDIEEYMKFLSEEMKKHHKKFLVHLSTQFDVDGKNAGSRITSWVDKDLHTLEEKRTE